MVLPFGANSFIGNLCSKRPVIHTFLKTLTGFVYLTKLWEKELAIFAQNDFVCAVSGDSIFYQILYRFASKAKMRKGREGRWMSFLHFSNDTEDRNALF